MALLGIGKNNPNQESIPDFGALLADFDSENRIFCDSFLTKCLHNEPVEEWESFRGSAGAIATQTIRSKQPTYRDAIFGDRAGIEFSGDDILKISNLASALSSSGGAAKPFSIFLALRFDILGDQEILSLSIPTAALPLQAIRGNATTYGITRVGNNGTSKSNNGGTSPYNTASNGHVWSVLFSGTVANHYVDGVQIGTNNGDLDVGAFDVTECSLGGRASNEAAQGIPDWKFSDVHIGRILIYSSVLSSTNRQIVEAALKARYKTG